MLRVTYATMVIGFLIAVSTDTNCLAVDTMGTTKSETCAFPRLGPYRIHGKHTASFSSFYEFQLRFRRGENQLTAKNIRQRSMLIDGELYVKPSEDIPKAQVEPYSELTVDGNYSTINVVKFRFEQATLRCEPDKSYTVAFTTEKIDGIHYGFRGQFLKEPKLVDGVYISLVGRMTKYKDGREAEEADLNFVNWSSE